MFAKIYFYYNYRDPPAEPVCVWIKQQNDDDLVSDTCSIKEEPPEDIMDATDDNPPILNTDTYSDPNVSKERKYL